jgi:hypothetical protein
MSGDTVTPGQRVDLKIRGLGSTSGKVEMLIDNAVVITLVVDPGEDAALLQDPDAALEYPAHRGLYRQEGFARFESGASVRFISNQGPQLVQRRDFARVDVRIPVEVTVQNSGAAIYQTLNVSANGLLLETSLYGADRLTLDTFVWLKIELGDDEQEEEGPIEARGTAVRDTGNGGIGIRFDHISEKHQERLVRFVFRAELEQRRREKALNG